MTSFGSVLCIGVFDGVHRGHQALLSAGRRRADDRNLPLIAVTFDPHPLSVVNPSQTPSALASLAHRRELLLEAGADAVDVLAFDPSMARLSPREFIDQELVARLRVRVVVVGEDFRFGHRASGTLETLRMAGAAGGFEVEAVPLMGEGAERWSSTAVRALVHRGDVRAAHDCLGRDYAVEGKVVHGDHRGRELGYPTANLAWEYRAAVPADGVYSGWLQIVDEAGSGQGAQSMPAAISVGTNPQFAGSDRRIEAYVLDRDLDLYGQRVRVGFTERLRGQQTFPTVDDLVQQMARDVERVRTGGSIAGG